MIAGAAAVLVGAGLIGVAMQARPVPHLPIGPGVLPAVVGLGLLGVGAALMVARREPHDPAPSRPDRTGLTGLALAIALPLALAATLETVGVALGLPLVLAPLLAWHGMPPGRAMLLAVAMTGALLALLGGLLRVPLPLGPLAGVPPWT